MIPREFWIVRAITGLAGLSLQLAGLYATVATFGAWFTLGLYAVGALAVVLQLAHTRNASCSPME